MANEITLAYMQEMVRRREGRLGVEQQILRLMSAVGRLADSLEDEREISTALGDVLYNTLALANTYGIDMEDCLPDTVTTPQQDRKPARGLDFRPL